MYTDRQTILTVFARVWRVVISRVSPHCRGKAAGLECSKARISCLEALHDEKDQLSCRYIKRELQVVVTKLTVPGENWSVVVGKMNGA